MNYATIKTYDTANGPGVRVSLFVSGCTHYCKDCFNSEAWDFNYGKPFTEETMEELLKAIDNSLAEINKIKGMSVFLDTVKNDMVTAITELSAVSEELGASAEEVAASCHIVTDACTDTQASTEEMRAINEHMADAIQFFKIGEEKSE